MQLQRKTQAQFTRFDQQQIFFQQIFNLKIFLVNSNNFIRVQVRVQKKIFSYSSSSSAT